MHIRQHAKSLKWIAAALALGLLTACYGHHSAESRADRMVDIVAYKLDFTDEQEALAGQIKDEVEVIREETEPQRDSQREEFIALFKADQLDIDELEALMERKRQQWAELAPRVMPLVVQLHASLSEEQKNKVIEFIEARRR